MLKRDTKINPTEYNILIEIMSYHQTEVPQSIFSRLENSTVKKAIRSLKDKGLIYKKYDLLDMRKRFICITEKGEMIFEKINNQSINSTS